MNRFLRICTAALALLMLISCTQQKEQPGAGRYIQQEIPLPDSFYPFTIAKSMDGTTYLFSRLDGMLSAAALDDAFACSRVELPWVKAWNANTEVKTYRINSITYQEKDTVSIAATESTESGEKIGHLFTASGDTLVETKQPISGDNAPKKAFCLPDGNWLAIGNMPPSPAIKIEPDGGAVLTSVGSWASDLLLAGENGVFVDVMDNRLCFFDPDTLEETQSFAMQNASDPSKFPLIAAREDGTVAVCAESGIDIVEPGASDFKQAVRGDITRLSSPTFTFLDMEALDQGDFLVLGDEIQGYSARSALYRYTYSTDVSTDPAKQLTVYSLKESLTIRTLIAEMQKNDADLFIKYTPALKGDSGMTASDAIRAANTELLAGKGADVYILDGMPVTSYMEKGALLDLSPVLEPLLQETYSHMVQAYRTGGNEVFAVPTRFFVPLLFGTAEQAASVSNLEDLIRWAQEHPETPLFAGMNGRNLFDRLYNSSLPEFLSGKQFDAEAFSAFLQNVKVLSETVPDADYIEVEQRINQEKDGMADKYTGKVQGIGMDFDDTWMFGIIGACFAAQEEEWSFGPMSSQASSGSGGVFLPRLIAGVNRNTGEADLAGQFVQQLLSEPIQSYMSNQSEGLPVRVSSLRGMVTLTEENREYIVAGSAGFQTIDGEDVSIEVAEWITTQQRDHFLEIAQNLNTLCDDDPTLYQLISDETASYFDGNRSLEETVSAVAERLESYLNE